MRLKLYRAGTVAEAMALVRRELGADAYVLSTRRVGEGVELTAALEIDDEAPFSQPVAPPAPLPASRLKPGPPPASTSPSLAWHGLSAALVQRLAAGDLAGTLGGLLRFGTLDLTGTATPLLFTGPPGAGKTLTVARLATRLVLAGISPAVITADGSRAAAAEQLAAYTHLLGLDLVVACQPATLARALTRSTAQHRRPGGAEAAGPVLIDSAGINPFDPAGCSALRELADAAGADIVLVLPAGQDPLEAAEQAACFGEEGAAYLLPTRLDMTRRLGSIVTAALAGNLILTEAGIGSSAAAGLTPLTPEFLAAALRRAPVPASRRKDAALQDG